jgi:hypothetical protein
VVGITWRRELARYGGEWRGTEKECWGERSYLKKRIGKDL